MQNCEDREVSDPAPRQSKGDEQRTSSWSNFFFCLLVFASFFTAFGSDVIVLTASQEPQAWRDEKASGEGRKRSLDVDAHDCVLQNRMPVDHDGARVGGAGESSVPFCEGVKSQLKRQRAEVVHKRTVANLGVLQSGYGISQIDLHEEQKRKLTVAL